MIVVDASAILEILGGSETGLKLDDALEHVEMHAPHLIDLEVANALRGWERGALIRPDEAPGLMALFLSMPITRHPHMDLLGEIWELRHNLTAYDASYLALARALDAELVTMDSGLKKRSKRR